MKIIIADDEPLARARLRELVEEIGGSNIIGEVSNGREALLMSIDLQAEIILMDIRMPGMDGLEAARHLSLTLIPPAVIFTTAYGDHALAAFDAHAVDYLMKPIRKERLEIALSRARQLTQTQLVGLQTSEPRARTHISALMHGNIELIPLSQIVYFKADNKYVTVRYLHGEVLIEDALTSIEEEFGSRFLRIHRNALVAYVFIAGLVKTRQGLMIKLREINEQLEISRRLTPAVKQILKGYQEKTAG